MNDGPPPLTLRQRSAQSGAADGYARRWAILTLSALVLTALGPFGTFQDFAFWPRLAYWGGIIAFGAAVFEAALRLCLRIRRWPAAHWGYPVGATTLLTSAVQTAVVWLVEDAARRPPNIPLPELYIYVLLVTLLVAAPPIWRELRARGLLDPTGESPAAPPGPANPEPANPESASRKIRPPFYDRIPGHLTGALLALEMEDHYLRIHTDGGSELILMRLRDAVAGLTAADGLQVHRSFWVAATAVADTAREPDGRITLILHNGLRVPVARSRLAAVRAAGWLRQT